MLRSAACASSTSCACASNVYAVRRRAWWRMATAGPRHKFDCDGARHYYWLLLAASASKLDPSSHRYVASSCTFSLVPIFELLACVFLCYISFFFLFLFLHTKSHGVGLRLRPTHPVQVGTHTVSSLTHLLDCCNLGIVVTAKCSSPRVWLLREQS